MMLGILHYELETYTVQEKPTIYINVGPLKPKL